MNSLADEPMATATGAAAPITGRHALTRLGTPCRSPAVSGKKAVPNARRKTEAGRLKATAVPSNT